MNRFILSLITVGMIAGPSTAFARSVNQLESQSRVTARFVDQTIVDAIKSVLPYIGPDGTVYNQDSINNWRVRMFLALKLHCQTHRGFNGLDKAVCELTQ